LSILQSIILGIVQGLTEFLPISSSGHLVIIPYFFNWGYSPLYFTVVVHFATLVAVLSVLYREAFRIIKAVILGIYKRSWRKNRDFKTGIYIIIASIPAALAGFFLDDYLEGLFSKPVTAAFFLMGTAVILWLGEFRGRKIELAAGLQGKRTVGHNAAKEGIDGQDDSVISIKYGSGENTGQPESGEGHSLKPGFNLFIAAVTGLGQALAILPGISRSGATISFARFFGIKRTEAVRFSFLLSIPVILGSFIFELYRASEIVFSGDSSIIWSLAAGFVFAYISGLIAVRFMLYLTGNRNLNVFALYCICLSLAVFVVYLVRRFM
jgi:undecaprenyl-diphosphatase